MRIIISVIAEAINTGFGTEKTMRTTYLGDPLKKNANPPINRTE